VATARSDFDGFFLFERVPYGSYSVRVAKTSAAAARIAIELGATATLTPEKSVVRLGAIHVSTTPVIASAADALATP
jgi:hypothetical protein